MELPFSLPFDMSTLLLGFALVATVIFAVGVYRYFFMGKKVIGSDCNPQIEGACGEGAVCHPDESGKKGVCFPTASPEAMTAPSAPVEEEQAQEQQEENQAQE